MSSVGEDRPAHNKINRRELIVEIRRLHGKVDGTPTCSDIEALSKYSVTPFYNEFGSIPAARDAAGLKREADVPPGNRLEKPALIDEVRRIYTELGRIPESEDMVKHGQYSKDPYYRIWDSWKDVLLEAGFKVAHIQHRGYDITDRELVAEVERLGEEYGRAPTYNEMAGEGKYSPNTYEGRFGSYRQGVIKAGYEPRDPGGTSLRGISCRKVQQKIRALMASLDRPPTLDDWREFTGHSADPIYRLYDSFPEAVADAGCENIGMKRQDISGYKLKGDIHYLAHELGRTPRFRDVVEYGEYALVTYLHRLSPDGTWNGLLKHLGYEPNQASPGEGVAEFDYGDSWTFELKERVREQHGRRCQSCGKSGEQNIAEVGARLSVHHIFKARGVDDEEERNDTTNLVPFCHECHPKWEGIPLRPELIG